MKKIVMLTMMLFLSACSTLNKPVVISNKVSDEQQIKDRTSGIIHTLDLETENINNAFEIKTEYYKKGKLVESTGLVESDDNEGGDTKLHLNFSMPEKKILYVNASVDRQGSLKQKIVLDKEYNEIQFDKVEKNLELNNKNKTYILGYLGFNDNKGGQSVDINDVQIDNYDEIVIVKYINK